MYVPSHYHIPKAGLYLQLPQLNKGEFTAHARNETYYLNARIGQQRFHMALKDSSVYSVQNALLFSLNDNFISYKRLYSPFHTYWSKYIKIVVEKLHS